MIRKIKKAKFTNLAHTEVVITFEDDSTDTHIVDKEMREHTSSYLTFLKEGGAVDDFETSEEKAVREAEEAKIKANLDREALLKKGALSADGKMWFNFESANMFMTAVGVLDVGESIPWYDKNRVEILLSYDDAKAYAKEIRMVMQALYGLGNS